MKKMSPCPYCGYYYSDYDDEYPYCHYQTTYDDGYDPCENAVDTLRHIEEDEKNV